MKWESREKRCGVFGEEEEGNYQEGPSSAVEKQKSVLLVSFNQCARRRARSARDDWRCSLPTSSLGIKPPAVVSIDIRRREKARRRRNIPAQAGHTAQHIQSSALRLSHVRHGKSHITDRLPASHCCHPRPITETDTGMPAPMARYSHHRIISAGTGQSCAPNTILQKPRPVFATGWSSRPFLSRLEQRRISGSERSSTQEDTRYPGFAQLLHRSSSLYRRLPQPHQPSPQTSTVAPASRCRSAESSMEDMGAVQD